FSFFALALELPFTVSCRRAKRKKDPKRRRPPHSKVSPQGKPSPPARPGSKAQQRIGEGEHLLPVGGTLPQHRASEPSGRVAQRLLGEVIDRAGAVDAGEHA